MYIHTMMVYGGGLYSLSKRPHSSIKFVSFNPVIPFLESKDGIG